MLVTILNHYYPHIEFMFQNHQPGYIPNDL
jgi:hypothetical protein